MMLRIRTRNMWTGERADIYCRTMCNFGKHVFLEDVETIDGEMDIRDYLHTTNAVHIYIDPLDVVFIEAATRQA